MDKDRIAGAAKDVVGKAESAAGRILSDKQSQVSGLYDQAAGKVQDTYGRAKDAVRDAAADAPEYMERALDAGQHYYEEGSKALSRGVEERPFVALLTAGIVGYVLGWMIHGRRY